MAKIQEVFNRIEEAKKKRREIKKIYREALNNYPEYQKIIDEIQILKEKKKQIEGAVQADFRSEFNKLDAIKSDLESDNILLSDIALNQILKGEEIEIIDEKENRYEPVFSIKFKKV